LRLSEFRKWIGGHGCFVVWSAASPSIGGVKGPVAWRYFAAIRAALCCRSHPLSVWTRYYRYGSAVILGLCHGW
jgi:hypothetical protein